MIAKKKRDINLILTLIARIDVIYQLEYIVWSNTRALESKL